MVLMFPAYFMASLLEMSDWGGTDAESLEKGITHIFRLNKSNIFRLNKSN